MRKNGKFIDCRKCKKSFYVSGSRIGQKHYCSWACLIADNRGFKPKNKKCVICSKEFVITHQLRVIKKTCSLECHKQLARNYSNKRSKLKRIDICKTCKKPYTVRVRYSGTGNCKPCIAKRYSQERHGKNNPNFKGGNTIEDEKIGKKTLYDGKHLYACSKYKRNFLKKHDYLYCEVCKVNKNAVFRFETHHIYYASRYPKHPNLHNPRNLILLCKRCHLNFHQGVYKEKFVQIEAERGLKELFN